MGLHAQIREGTSADFQTLASSNALVPGFWYFATDTSTMHYAKAANLLSGPLRDTDPPVSSGIGQKKYQFFPASNALTISIVVDPQTLPTDNNLITVHAQGNRIFPDQGATVLDWTRDAQTTPDQITLHSRDGEWIIVEWYES